MSHQEPEIDFTQVGYVQKTYAYLEQGKEQALSSLQQRYPDYALLALGVYIDIFGFEHLEDKDKASSALIELIEHCVIDSGYTSYWPEPFAIDFSDSAVRNLFALHKNDKVLLDGLFQQRLDKHFSAYLKSGSKVDLARITTSIDSFSAAMVRRGYISHQSLKKLEKVYFEVKDSIAVFLMRDFFLDGVLSFSLAKRINLPCRLHPEIFKDVQYVKAPCHFKDLLKTVDNSQREPDDWDYTISGTQKYQLVDENGFLSYEHIVKAWDQIARREQETE